MQANALMFCAEDRLVWDQLFTRQIKTIEHVSYAPFKKGLEALGFHAGHIPRFEEINETIGQLTGWQIYPVPGLIDNRHFFEQMMGRRFGSTQWLRKLSQLDYLEEPDMFHDVFGHIPLLTDPAIAEFLEGLANVANKHLDNEEVIEAIARIYWYTVEFGLVQEGTKIKIYGAGILSSIGESDFCLSVRANRIPFDLEKVIDTPYVKDKFQEQYFVLYSITQLKNVLKNLEMKYKINN